MWAKIQRTGTRQKKKKKGEMYAFEQNTVT